ncbi:hypothetical protein F5887DRAFT_974338, partial [Amanita rubescens]
TRTGVERNPASTSLVHVGLPPTSFHLVWPLLLQIYLSTRPHLPLLLPTFFFPRKKSSLPHSTYSPLPPPSDPTGSDLLSKYRSAKRRSGYAIASDPVIQPLPAPLAHSILLMHRLSPSLPAMYSHKEIGRENSVEVDVTLVHDKSTPEDIASRCRVVKTMTTLDMMHTGSCASSTNDPFRIPAY